MVIYSISFHFVIMIFHTFITLGIFSQYCAGYLEVFLNSPNTQSFGRPGQQTAMRPAAVSPAPAQGLVLELGSGHVGCQPPFAGWVTGQEWEPQPGQSPPQIPSGPDNPPSPTPSSLPLASG